MLYHFAAMKNPVIRCAIFVLLLGASLSTAQGQNAGSLKTEYLDDFAETSKHLDQLSQAMPANKYSWRPGAGVRSVSEVYVHIANGNFLLLSLTGVKLPTEYFPNLPTDAKGKPDTQALFKRMGELEKTVTEKDAVTIAFEEAVRRRAGQLGLEIVAVGVRDIILPGEMKDLMNKVTEAKKAAEANLIVRREETAAMRSQANTAKVLADNPTLMRLRELEVLEKVATSGKLSVVLGEKGLAARVVNLL